MSHKDLCIASRTSSKLNILVYGQHDQVLQWAILLAGGWLQVAVKHMPMSSLIVGVDLVPIRPIRGAKTIIGDITSAQCRQVHSRDTSSHLYTFMLQMPFAHDEDSSAPCKASDTLRRQS